MARGRIAQNALLQIHKEIGGGDEMLFEFSAQSLVEARENARGIVCVRDLSSERNFQHGGDQSRGNAVTCNVRDKNAEVLFINGEEIIEVAGNGTHGSVTGCDF